MITCRFLYSHKYKKLYADLDKKYKSHTDLAYHFNINEDEYIRFLYTYPSDYNLSLLDIDGLDTSSIDDYYSDTEDISLFELDDTDFKIIIDFTEKIKSLDKTIC